MTRNAEDFLPQQTKRFWLHVKAERPWQYDIHLDLRISKVEGVTTNLVEDDQGAFESDDSFDRETLHRMLVPRQLAVGCLPVHVKAIHFFAEVHPRVTACFWEVYARYCIFQADIILSECRA